MATISITVSNEFVTAVQTEAALDGVGAQAWAKAAIKAEIVARRGARTREAAELQRIADVQAALQAAQATADAALAAELALVEGLN